MELQRLPGSLGDDLPRKVVRRGTQPAGDDHEAGVPRGARQLFAKNRGVVGKLDAPQDGEAQ